MSVDEDENRLDFEVENNQDALQVVRKEKYARIKLYIGCALSFWGDRMWFFAVGLCIHYLNPRNFLMAAIYGLSSRTSIIILIGPIGRWIDRTPRFRAASLCLIIQNGSVVVCATCLLVILVTKYDYPENWRDIFLTIGQCLVVAFASVGSVASVSSSISVQKDWVKVIADGDKELLAAMNTTVRCLDLTSSILAPIAVGHMMLISPIFGATFLAGWNLLSVFFEYWLLMNVYKAIPRLAIKPAIDHTEESKNSKHSTMAAKFLKHYGGWKIYWNQEMLLAGLGFAYLYMTVLVFDSITIAYSTAQGISENIMGALVAAGGLSGIMGTVAYPYFRKCIGLDCTGFLGFTLELLCLSLCVASIWSPGSPFHPFYVGLTPLRKSVNSTHYSRHSSSDEKVEHITLLNFNKTVYQETPSSYLSISLLLGGITLSRFGLWIADLSVHQEIQELVAEKELGAVSGVQSSLNQIFGLLKFILVAVVRWKETFGILVMLSFAFVFCGWLSYAVFLKRRTVSRRSRKTSHEIETDKNS